MEKSDFGKLAIGAAFVGAALATPKEGGSVISIPTLETEDRSQSVPTGGIPVLFPNAFRRWATFVNEGPSIVDCYFLAQGSVVIGKIVLGPLASLTISKYGPIEWYGSLSMTARDATTEVSGVECWERF